MICYPIPGAEHPPDLPWRADEGHATAYGLTDKEAAARLAALLAREGDSMLTPYPTSFTGAAAILLRKYRGEEVSGPELAHACYEMVGYGLGQLYPDGSDTMVGSRAAAMGAIAAAPTLADEQMCAQLETMAHCHAGGPLVGFVIPWAAILKKLLPLILDLL